MLRAPLFYLLSFAGVSFFGQRVCSFLCTLDQTEVWVVLGAAYAFCLALRTVGLHLHVTRLPLLRQPGTQFRLDLVCFTLPGLLLGAYDAVVHGFPFGSGVKVMASCATIGFYLGLDLALDRERRILADVVHRGLRLLPASRSLPITTRFAILGATAVLLPVVDIALLVGRDIEQLGLFPALSGASMQRSIFVEIVFVLLVLGALAVNLVVSFARNLRLFFEAETKALERVADGDLSETVPVFTNDEFGRIAALTNAMIERLRERNLAREVLGKVVSPEIAHRLMEGARDGLGLGGTRRMLVVLFCDLRDFTATSERLDPEETIEKLNGHLGRMVACLRAEGAIVDKFIGDGILAVFGLEDPVGASRAAVRAAIAMRRAAAPDRLGIGIHRGEGLAGIVGSPDRLEFTFIGDVVNTASRIEAYTKEADAEILASSDVVDELRGSPEAEGWTPLGARLLKGKSREVTLYRLA